MYASKHVRSFLAAIVVLGLFVAPASAQEARVGLSGGYQLNSLEPGHDMKLTQRIGIRVGADYLRIFNEQEGRDIGDLSGGDRGDHTLRFVAGVVVPLGR